MHAKGQHEVVSKPPTRRQRPPIVASVVRSRRRGELIQELTLHVPRRAFRPVGPDQYVLLVADGPRANPGTVGSEFRELDLRRLRADQRPLSGYYTVRRYRPERGELDLWISRHMTPRTVSQWATEVAPGTKVALFGPRGHFRLPFDAESVILLGDETAYAAVAAIGRSVAGRVSVRAYVETHDAPGPIDLELPRRARVHWVSRNGQPPGTSLGLLEHLARQRLSPQTVVFAACEAVQIAQIRQHLRRRRELPPHNRHMIVYWRRIPAVTHHPS